MHTVSRLTESDFCSGFFRLLKGTCKAAMKCIIMSIEIFTQKLIEIVSLEGVGDSKLYMVKCINL